MNLGLGRISGVAERFFLEECFDRHREQRVPWAMGAFLLVRRSAWDQVGGFDERQWMYAEEIDLCWRLRQAGWATIYVPRATVIHHRGAATSKTWNAQARAARELASTYAWMLRRRGVIRTRAFATICVLASSWRLALYASLARLHPARFGPRRKFYAEQAQNHCRFGFASRAFLEGHG
jgi:GT2 family glycosyltransferase